MAGSRSSTSLGSPERLPAPDVVLAVGASAGGTEALREFLSALPATCPPVLIVQHMPAHFTGPFAERLDGLSALTVREARHGDRVGAGCALVAPGGRHMRLVRDPTGYAVALGSDPPVRRHRPSVDVLFASCAAIAGARAIGIIMTGMGNDGARGLLAMRRAGAHTIAQDEATSVVFGMPRAAIALAAAEQVLPLGGLAREALRLLRTDRALA